jgi:hypothetical protein
VPMGEKVRGHWRVVDGEMIIQFGDGVNWFRLYGTINIFPSLSTLCLWEPKNCD